METRPFCGCLPILLVLDLVPCYVSCIEVIILQLNFTYSTKIQGYTKLGKLYYDPYEFWFTMDQLLIIVDIHKLITDGYFIIFEWWLAPCSWWTETHFDNSVQSRHKSLNFNGIVFNKLSSGYFDFLILPWLFIILGTSFYSNFLLDP